MKVLPICFYGHRRRKLAVLVLQRLKQYLKFTGYKPVLIFGNCGHDEEYVKTVQEAAGDWLYMTIQGEEWEDIHNGLNDAMNKTLKEAFKLSPVVLRLEDDWVLEKELDIGPWCDLLQEDDKVCGVRLGQIQIDPECVKPYRPDLGLDWLDYMPNARYPINHQCFLVHKRLYDLVGWYREDMSIDEAEFSFGRRFRILTHNFKDGPKVLWPHGQPVDLDESPARFFVHAGGSTLGHTCFDRGVPEKYWKYQEDGWRAPLAITGMTAL